MSIKLLVAEDEDSIRKGISKYIQLHTNRFSKIYEAENGQEAIDLLLKYQPEMLLLDVQMPLKTGIEVMREAKKAKLNPVIVILSGYDEFQYAQQAVRYGAKEYLLKPARASDILACLNRLADDAFGPEKVDVLLGESAQTNHFVRMAQEYIAEHYPEKLSLAEVAEVAGISSGYLSSLFTQNLNCSFVDYLNQVRIDRACVYLEQNSLKNYEIAYRVGFQDEKYFSKLFKKLKGMSPKEYRMEKKDGRVL